MNHRRRAVSPDSSGLSNVNIIEIRPGRWLGIQHLLPGERPTNSDTDSQTAPSTSSRNGQVETRSAGVINSKDVELTSDSTPQVISDSNSSSGKQCTENASLPQINSHISHSDGGSTFGSQKELEDSYNSMTYRKLVNHAYQTPHRTNNVDTGATYRRRGSKWSSQASLVSLMEEPGTVLFFLHGVGGCGEVWHHQIDYFQRAGFEMVVPDMLGHGFSRAPRQTLAYTFEELAEDMLSVFDRYAKKRNILIGHSYG